MKSRPYSERYCVLPTCGIQLVPRKGEPAWKFNQRKCCCAEHALATKKLAAVRGGGEKRGSGANHAPVTDLSRFALTIEEERQIGTDMLRRLIRLIGGFPLDGSKAFSVPKIYKPGDADFEAVAATVTPIEQIPVSHNTYRVW